MIVICLFSGNLFLVIGVYFVGIIVGGVCDLSIGVGCSFVFRLVNVIIGIVGYEEVLSLLYVLLLFDFGFLLRFLFVDKDSIFVRMLNVLLVLVDFFCFFC